MIENIDGEEWKDITGWDGRYMISNHGRVKRLSKKHLVKAVRKLKVEKRGYHIVTLGHNTQYKVHRLVATHFLGEPPEGKYVVNHKDSNKINNHVSNLEWCNHWHNLVHAVSKGRKHKNRTQNIFNRETCDIINDAIVAGFTMNAIARYFKACPKTIATIRNKTHWSYIYGNN